MTEESEFLFLQGSIGEHPGRPSRFSLPALASPHAPPKAVVFAEGVYEYHGSLLQTITSHPCSEAAEKKFVLSRSERHTAPQNGLVAKDGRLRGSEGELRSSLLQGIHEPQRPGTRM